MTHRFQISLHTMFAAALVTGCYSDVQTSSTAREITCSDSSTVLIAGQNIEVGDVAVHQDENLLCVTFVTSGDWYITENHLAIADDPELLPQTGSGNPQPGQFPYKRTNLDTQSDTHCVDYVAAGFPLDASIYLAAHAVVERRDGGSVVQTETAWGEGQDFSGKNWAMYFDHTLQTCETGPTSCEPTVTTSDMLLMAFPRSYALEEYHLSDCASVTFDPACDTGLDIDELGTIVSVASDEPVNIANHPECASDPSLEHCNDIVISDNSTSSVRNTRDSYGDGRVYTIEFTVDDGYGNVSQVYTCEIGVRLWDTHVPVGGPAAYTVYP